MNKAPQQQLMQKNRGELILICWQISGNFGKHFLKKKTIRDFLELSSRSVCNLYCLE